MLNEDIKREIEEKVRYEAEIRQKYQENNNISKIKENPYTEKLSDEIIKNVVIPKLEKADSILKHLESLASEINNIQSHKDNLLAIKISVAFNRIVYIVAMLLSFIVLIKGLMLENKEVTTAIDKSLYHVVDYYKFLDRLFGLIPVKAVLLQLVLVVLFFLTLFIITPIVTGGIIGFVLSFIYTITIRNPILNKQIQNKDKVIIELQNILIDYYEKNAEHINFLPEKYHNSDASTQILVIFQSYRAESMKEAFTLYETDLHNRKMESSFINIESAIDKLSSGISYLMNAAASKSFF